MPERIKINDEITIGSQPESDEISRLAADDFQSVINFRTKDEQDQPLSPDAERELVESAVMTYLHFPVSMASMKHGTVDTFREQLKSLPKPLFAHCKSGKRAGAMMMMHVAIEENMSGEQTLQKAEAMGFECDVPELKQFVRSYVNERTE